MSSFPGEDWDRDKDSARGEDLALGVPSGRGEISACGEASGCRSASVRGEGAGERSVLGVRAGRGDTSALVKLTTKLNSHEWSFLSHPDEPPLADANASACAVWHSSDDQIYLLAMLPWLPLLRALISLAATIITQLRERQLIEAGRAIEIAKSLELARGRIDEALAARRAARIRNADPAGLRDDDGFRRED